VTRAAALAGRVSEGEKHMVLGLDAAMKGNVPEVLSHYDDAEAAFKKYVQLIPDDPNPLDSYAELLMKRGRFADDRRAAAGALPDGGVREKGRAFQRPVFNYGYVRAKAAALAGPATEYEHHNRSLFGSAPHR
jgi:hypothetical protein